MYTFTYCVGVVVNMMSDLQFSVTAFFGYSEILFLRLVAPNQFSYVFSLNSFITLLNSFSFLLKSPSSLFLLIFKFSSYNIKF